MVRFRKGCESLYDTTCDIYVFTETVNTYGVSEFKDVLISENVPCHLSQTAIQANNDGEKSTVTNTVAIYFSPEINVPSGSKIVCNGIAYHNTGIPAIYTKMYQKLQLELWTDKT